MACSTRAGDSFGECQNDLVSSAELLFLAVNSLSHPSQSLCGCNHFPLHSVPALLPSACFQQFVRLTEPSECFKCVLVKGRSSLPFPGCFFDISFLFRAQSLTQFLDVFGARCIIVVCGKVSAFYDTLRTMYLSLSAHMM